MQMILPVLDQKKESLRLELIDLLWRNGSRQLTLGEADKRLKELQRVITQEPEDSKS